MSERFNSIKAHIRDINLDMITGTHQIKLDVSKRYNTRFRFRMPNKELINYVIKMGGVLTGSRAMKCYSVNNKPMLDRKSFDWDFIITTEMAFKICDKFDISELYSVGDTITIKRHRWYVHPAYSESYRIGPVDVHLIINDKLPEFIEQKGIRVASFNYAINEKIKLINSLLTNPPIMSNTGYSYISRNVSKEESDKHLDDLTQLIIKFNCIDGKENI